MSASETPVRDRGPGAWLILSLAIACGVTVANIYYAQPLVGPIGESFGLGLATVGFILAILQIGYVLGLVFLVPLGDLVENKALILLTLGFLIASLVLSAAAPTAAVFIAASFLVGVAAVGTQMILPVAAHLTPERIRGQTVGTVMSGLMFGILLARPLATMVAGEFGWRAVYVMSAAAMCGVIVLMACALPRRRPQHALTYPRLIRSLWHVLLTTPVLQRRAAYQALLFGTLIMFWTSVPLLLEAPPFSLGHVALSAFMLTGAASALIAPVAGRFADRGYTRALTGVAMAAVAIGFVLTWFGSRGSLTALVLASILLDAGAQGNFVVGQRMIYALPGDIRSRLNALHLAIIFFGGAIGSAISGYAVARGGAASVSLIGLGFTGVALALFATEFVGKRRS